MKLSRTDSIAIIDAIKESGLPLAFICRKNKLNYGSFWSWVNGYSHAHQHDTRFRNVLVREIGIHVEPILFKDKTNYEITGRLS